MRKTNAVKTLETKAKRKPGRPKRGEIIAQIVKPKKAKAIKVSREPIQTLNALSLSDDYVALDEKILAVETRLKIMEADLEAIRVHLRAHYFASHNPQKKSWAFWR